MQPVALRPGRGARLSFLGPRKKDVPQQTLQPITQQTNGDRARSSSMNGDISEQASTGSHDGSRRRSRSASKGHQDTPNRLSLFRVHSAQENKAPGGITGSLTNGTDVSSGGDRMLSRSGTVGTTDWVTDSGGGSRGSYDTHVVAAAALEKERAGAGTPKLGGMKKRLSLLKIGKKSSKGSAVMGSLDEE